MKSGPNSSEENKIATMLASGAEPAGISAVLGINLKSIEMYTDKGRKQAADDRELLAVEAVRVAKDQAIARVKAQAAAEVAAEEEEAMLAKVKADEIARLKGVSTQVPPRFDLPLPNDPKKPPPLGKPERPPVTKKPK